MRAAELGEFEHPIYTRADATLGEYTCKEIQEDGTVEAKETKQPGVGPYRSTLSMEDGRPVNSIYIQNYIKARRTAPRATDRETRRIVAREMFLSVEGLRRWCDEPEFARWAKLRRLSRPKFIKLATTPTTVGAEKKCTEWLTRLMEAGPPEKRKVDYQEEAATLFEVGTKAFGRSWANAVAETRNVDWTRPGPKS